MLSHIKHVKNFSEKNGFDYPELLIVIIGAILTAHQFQLVTVATIIMAILVVTCLLVFYYNQKLGMRSTQSIVTVILLSLAAGFSQFSVLFTLGLLLLIGIRIALSHPKLRFRMLAYVVVSSLAAAFVTSVIISIPIESNDTFDMLLLVMALIIAVWQFWLINKKSWSTTTKYKELHGRIGTLVSVINKLTRFIPIQVWQPVIQNNAPVKVSNKRTKLTVMFSDIAGFTELSERLSADDVADILNTYMERMTLIAKRYDAVLDKFIGDGMVCFFGAPTSNGIREDALACTAMAIDMRREMRTLRHQWRLQGFEGLYIRIGITTGYCHVGNFGSDSRMSYTLIGSEANLASRLESVADNGSILVSQSTYDYICHEYKCVFQGDVKLKGFSNPVKTYAVLDPNADDLADSRWVDYDLPGFNLHLNFENLRNYDYRIIKNYLNQALEKVSKEELKNIDKNKDAGG